MERKKFILFEENPAQKRASGGFGTPKSTFTSVISFGSGTDLVNEPAQRAVDFSRVTQGMGFACAGDGEGEENIIQNSDFDPSGTSAWALSVGSNAAATPGFGPTDFSHQFETTSSAFYGGGRLKMRFYQGVGNPPPFVTQDVVLGEGGLVIKVNWVSMTDFVTGETFESTTGGIIKLFNPNDIPAVRITYNGNSTNNVAIANGYPSGTPNANNTINTVTILSDDITALGASPGDTVTVELLSKYNTNFSATKDIEHVFDKIEVTSTGADGFGYYIFNPYEVTDFFTVFKGVTPEEGLEDMIKVLEASSSAGINGNKESLISVEDLDLNATKAFAEIKWT